MRLLKPFGQSSKNHDLGYTLPLLIGHLEALAFDEEDSVELTWGPKAKRLALVEDALELLNQASDMGNET